VLGVSLFVAGFSLIFVLFMVLASSVGIWLVQYQDLITRIMGVVVIVMGLVFVGLFRPLQQTKKLSLAPKVGLAGAPVLGAGFAVGWTPCLGPTLIAISSLSLQSGSLTRGALLGLAYCVGLGIPFVLVAIGFGWVSTSTNFLRRHIRTINIIGGSVLVLIGVLMVTGIWNQMMYSLQAVMNAYVTPL
jgi:cytochrome c-type biogenesis protein